MNAYPSHPTSPRDSRYIPDGWWRDVLIEIKTGSHSLRNLRATILQLAYEISNQPSKRGLVVLANSRITDSRIQEEMQNARSVIRADIMDRLHVAIRTGEGKYQGLPKDADDSLREKLDILTRQQTTTVHRRGAYYVVLELLIHEWLLDHGPRTIDWIMESSGYSYPSVAATLLRLGKSITRETDRRVSLNRFPMMEWNRLVANSNEIRETIQFTDRTGQPRPVEALLDRLSELGRSDIAIGGVVGAEHYLPELDLIGIPRLDLSIHSPAKPLDLSFMRSLDPGLDRMSRVGEGEAVRVAIHAVRRTYPLFQSGKKGQLIADPVECLLDLHEARLESQAEQFLEAMISRQRGLNNEG